MAAGSMTQEAAGSGGRDVWRVAASGDPVELTLPAMLGDFRWYGNTRFTGPQLARQFFLAPAGEHRGDPGQDPARRAAGAADDARLRRRGVRGRRPFGLGARPGRPVPRGHHLVRRPGADGCRDRASTADVPLHRLRQRRHPRPGLGHARAAARRVAHRAQRPLRPRRPAGHRDAADAPRVGRAHPAGRRAVAGRPRPGGRDGRTGRRRPAPVALRPRRARRWAWTSCCSAPSRDGPRCRCPRRRSSTRCRCSPDAGRAEMGTGMSVALAVALLALLVARSRSSLSSRCTPGCAASRRPPATPAVSGYATLVGRPAPASVRPGPGEAVQPRADRRRRLHALRRRLRRARRRRRGR